MSRAKDAKTRASRPCTLGTDDSSGQHQRYNQHRKQSTSFFSSLLSSFQRLGVQGARIGEGCTADGLSKEKRMPAARPSHAMDANTTAAPRQASTQNVSEASPDCLSDLRTLLRTFKSGPDGACLLSTEACEAQLRASPLALAIVRSPRLTSKPAFTSWAEGCDTSADVAACNSVVFVNTAALELFAIQSQQDFGAVLGQQLQQSAQVLETLVDACSLDVLPGRRPPVHLGHQGATAQLTLEAAACHILTADDPAPSATSAGVIISYRRDTSQPPSAAYAAAADDSCRLSAGRGRGAPSVAASADASSPQDLDAVLMANLGFLVMALDVAGNIVHQNQTSADYMGCSSEALVSPASPSGGDASSLFGLMGWDHSPLRQLLRHEHPVVLHDLMEVLTVDQQEWSSTVRLPPQGQVLTQGLPAWHRIDEPPLTNIDEQSVTRSSLPSTAADSDVGFDGQESCDGRTAAGSGRASHPRPERSSSFNSGTVRRGRSGPKRSSSGNGLKVPSSERPSSNRSRQGARSPHSISDRVMRFFSPDLVSTVCDDVSESEPSESINGGSAYRPASRPVWHDVVAKVVRDPRSGADLLMLTALNVNHKVKADQQVAMILGAEHAILEQLFPRHVIEYMAAASTSQQRRLSTASSSAAQASVTAAADGGGAVDSTTPCSSQRNSEDGNNNTNTLCRKLGALSTSHEQVTVMFADIVGFTSLCKVVPPATVMAFLNELYSAFDELVAIYRVYKVETAGDCYIVAGGLMSKDEDGFTSVRKDVDPLNAVTVLEFAKAMLREASKVLNPATGRPIEMRVGLHSGPVVSGVVGTRMPRFCLFGDTMNTAQRMESASRAGAIHVSDASKLLLPDERWEGTGGIDLKGLGMCQTYFWVPREDPAKAPSESARRISAAFERRYGPADTIGLAGRVQRLHSETNQRRYSLSNTWAASGQGSGVSSPTAAAAAKVLAGKAAIWTGSAR